MGYRAKGGGAYFGRCGLLPWEIIGKSEVEVAYQIAQEYWGMGYGCEAINGVLEYAFFELKLTKLG